MMNFVPILYLRTVVFPREHLNLHLSEKADIALVKDCITESKPLGILLHVQDEAFKVDFGTLVEVLELTKILKNGDLYVRLKGIREFRVMETKSSLPDKLYGGAIVEYPEQEEVAVSERMKKMIISEVKRLYQLMHLDFPKEMNWYSFEFAHKIGLSLKQEYELLTLTNEMHRMEFIRRHLKAMMPVVKDLEAMKKRIQMNGHFRNWS